MTLFVSLERGGSIGALRHATGTNGDAAGARSSKSMINGTTGDTGNMSNDQVQQSQQCGRYSRVSRNQKEILVKLVFVDGRITHEVAQIAGVIENTARSIINSCKRGGEIVERTRGGNGLSSHPVTRCFSTQFSIYR
ncbi:unnamed protein product [Heligmosomoides polygyrus]|uniref:HTH_Tnp_Tc3_1 domain-containing protein n=1 Tax=Heligmosomoides polygyrus TaxID=6339 RepID=A0A183GCI3_HELPZ|nr:unnamed protein product [Heligmosomoides polygyrus]